MQLKFFLGACLLTGALLLPHGQMPSIVGGMMLAGLIQFVWAIRGRRRD
ncbi:MAG TPA: hypothetical protein VMS40_04815 [Vicinamibacterales bacterium]|nr:hypothetical protein [Vicinamibacterales bacterium]